MTYYERKEARAKHFSALCRHYGSIKIQEPVFYSILGSIEFSLSQRYNNYSDSLSNILIDEELYSNRIANLFEDTKKIKSLISFDRRVGKSHIVLDCNVKDPYLICEDGKCILYPIFNYD